MRNVLNIEVRKIVVPEGRMRPVNAARVEELQDSIGKGQLLLPLVVGVPNAHKQWPLVDGAHRLAALKKLKYRLVHCLSIRGNEAVRRLAEIEANLVRSPLTRLQIHRHEAEARHLRDAIYGPTKRGGDRGNQYTGGKVANGHGDRLPESDSLAARAESTEARKRSERRSVRLCKLLSAEECDRLEGTAVERCDRDLFAIAGIGDIRKRTAARFRTPKNPRPRCMRRSVAQDLHRLWKAISRRSSSRAQIACSIPSFTERGALWSGFCIRSQTSSPNSLKFCPRW